MKSSNKDKKLDNFVNICKEHGLKLTPQRMAIYEEISGSNEHPSTEIIYKKIIDKYPNISFDTVNRTLLTFVEIGILEIVEGYGNSRRFDPNLNNHHHIHCIKCGSILDFEDRDYDNLELPSLVSSKFKVLSKKVIINGICMKCQKK